MNFADSEDEFIPPEGEFPSPEHDELLQQIVELEDSWSRQSRRLMLMGRHGDLYEPTVLQGVLVWVAVSALAYSFAAKTDPLVGWFGAALATFLGLREIVAAREFQRAKRRYEQRRQQLQADLDALVS